jgi:hypothetical protein
LGAVKNARYFYPVRLFVPVNDAVVAGNDFSNSYISKLWNDPAALREVG